MTKKKERHAADFPVWMMGLNLIEQTTTDLMA